MDTFETFHSWKGIPVAINGWTGQRADAEELVESLPPKQS